MTRRGQKRENRVGEGYHGGTGLVTVHHGACDRPFHRPCPFLVLSLGAPTAQAAKKEIERGGGDASAGIDKVCVRGGQSGSIGHSDRRLLLVSDLTCRSGVAMNDWSLFVFVRDPRAHSPAH